MPKRTPEGAPQPRPETQPSPQEYSAANEAMEQPADSLLDPPEPEGLLEQREQDARAAVAALEARLESFSDNDIERAAFMQDLRDALESEPEEGSDEERQQNAIRAFAAEQGLEGELYAEDVDPDVSEIGDMEEPPDVSHLLIDENIADRFERIRSWAESAPDEWATAVSGTPELAAIMDEDMEETYQWHANKAAAGFNKSAKELKRLEATLQQAEEYLPGMQDASYKDAVGNVRSNAGEGMRVPGVTSSRSSIERSPDQLGVTPPADVPAEYAWAQELFDATMASADVEQSLKEELAAFDVQSYAEANDQLEALQNKGWWSRNVFNRGDLKRAQRRVQEGSELLARMQRATGAEIDTVVEAPIGGIDTSAPYSNAPRSQSSNTSVRSSRASRRKSAESAPAAPDAAAAPTVEAPAVESVPEPAAPEEVAEAERAPLTVLQLSDAWPDSIANILEDIAAGRTDAKQGFDALEEESAFVDWVSGLKGTTLADVRRGNGTVVDEPLTITSVRKTKSGMPTVFMKRPDGRPVSMQLEIFIKQNLTPKDSETGAALAA